MSKHTQGELVTSTKLSTGLVEEKVGFKQTKLGLIPKDWSIKFLDEIGEFSKGKGIAKKDILDDEIDGFSCVRYAEIYTIYHYNTTLLKSKINQESAENSNPINCGDMLFAGSGETLEDIGKSIAYLGEHTAYAGGDIIILKNHNQDSRYLGYLFNNDLVRSQLFKIGQGHSVVHIYASGLKKVLVPLPPLPEQQKIASILNTWDKAIAAQEKLISEKQKLKNGLMQQLLTGKKRFPGFEEEWEESKLGDIFKFKQGLQAGIEKQYNLPEPGLIPFVRIINVTNSNSEMRYIETPDSSHIIDQKDLFMIRYGEAGKVAIGYEGVIANNLFRLIPKIELSNKFVYYFLDLQYKRINSLGGSSTMPALKFSSLSNYTIYLPSISEQNRIKNCIDSLEDELNNSKKVLISIKSQKQGLMQQLLTGKKRVKI